MFSTEEVKSITEIIAKKYDGSLEDKEDSFGVKIVTSDKLLYIDWPKHDLAEVWITFQQNGKDLYQDWFECFENEDKTEFVEYITSIPEKFFNSEVRVKRYGLTLNRYVLEYKNGSEWRSILEG
jgi:hypothetical protein